MRRYETLVVFDPQLGEAQVRDELKRIEDLVKPRVSSYNADFWGKKELAYEVGKSKYGTFVQLVFEGEDFNVSNDLCAWLRLNERVIKFNSCKIALKRRKARLNPKMKVTPDMLADDFSLDMDY